MPPRRRPARVRARLGRGSAPQAEPVDNLIHIGTLVRPHGIKGEIRVECYADSPALLCGVIYLQAGVEAPLRVEGAGVRLHRGCPLISLPHVPDRTAAEGLCGVRVLVRREDLPEPAADEVYVHDILGFAVHDVGSGAVVGVLEAVEIPAGQDIWVVRHASGAEVLVPAVPELLDSVDAAARVVNVRLPRGLLDVYLAPEGTTPATTTQG